MANELSEVDRKAAASAYRKEYCVPMTVSDSEIEAFPDWAKWLRSWRLATQAAYERAKKAAGSWQVVTHKHDAGSAYHKARMEAVAAIDALAKGDNREPG